MNVLWLGPERQHLFEYLHGYGDCVTQTEECLVGDEEILQGKDFLISYGYRHKLSTDVLELFKSNRALNMHISLLPWNRGSDPNLWSFLEDTPKGVTIHLLNEGLDKGDIVIQKNVEIFNDATLRSSYQQLCLEMERLFVENWPLIRDELLQSKPQEPGGSYHASRDKIQYEHLLTQGWDTPVRVLIAKAFLMKERLIWNSSRSL